MERFAKRLKKLRKEDSLSQADLGEKLGYARTTIANYEQATRFPSIDTLFSIADFFEVSLDYLLGRTEIRNVFKDLVIDNFKTPVLLIEPESGKIVDFNKSAVQYYGFSKREMFQKSIFEINSMDNQLIQKKIEQIMEKGSMTFNFQHKLASGKMRQVTVFSSTLTINDKKILYSTIFDRNSSNNNLTSIDFFSSMLKNIFKNKLPLFKNHNQRVKRISKLIADDIKLNDKKKKLLIKSSSIHDIGFLVLPSQLLNKGDLTKSEFELIKEHSQFGSEIFSDFNRDIAQIILQHHERLDGSGYPDSLKEDQIRIEAKIIAVADVFEAMNSDRPYRKKPGFDKACQELLKHRGVKYESEIVDSCLKLAENNKLDFLRKE
ncbi:MULTISPECIES: HD domain-containing phosphohydrolase [Halanaerobium]|jgi:PAS domain S-box-containing protein|uniref:PAS domain S-box-containing protein n=1 Tax=Halanaerobium kushneri TaxID=56779 RepID=A0A1N6VTG5_9FIRM|nr:MULTISPECIES: HD domain-containing phosphohydrolase [Halanaerobium]RCW56565.1 PAS domain S-box-containing protein [Halanaerobium sp. ST460_2HS_T2]SIQ81149.1 PAS domain S-box-containing protein [Halanaerobium kushneri]